MMSTYIPSLFSVLPSRTQPESRYVNPGYPCPDGDGDGYAREVIVGEWGMIP